MDKIIGVGRSILVLQVLFAGGMYLLGILFGAQVGELGLAVAGLIAVGFIAISIYKSDVISTGIASASLCAVLMLLSASVGSYSATVSLAFFMLVFAMISARLAQQTAVGEYSFAWATFLALPAIGPVSCLIFSWLDKVDKGGFSKDRIRK